MYSIMEYCGIQGGGEFLAADEYCTQNNFKVFC